MNGFPFHNLTQDERYKMLNKAAAHRSQLIVLQQVRTQILIHKFYEWEHTYTGM